MKRSLLLFVAFFSPALFAQTKPGEARKWEHESSDLPTNSRIHFGKLDNGLRFAWIKNSEPKERCYVNLHVNVGSLAEEREQAGIAHFLEHMAFNGSEHYPPGTLIEWFQKHGMAFGADINASTSFSQTVYKIDLPKSDEKSFGEALTVLRDYADRQLLTEKEVQEEKGVIDGEDRERDSAGFRVFIKQLELAFDGTRYPTNVPIGNKPVRDRFDAKKVRAFYSKWYRPENMTLVAVGDFGGLDPEKQIREAFGSMKAPANNPDPEPPLGKPTMKTLFYFIYEKEIPTVSISVEKLTPYEDDPDNAATRTKYLARNFARNMLNLRFAELVKKEGAPFLSASVGGGGGLKIFEGEELSVSATPEKWKEAFAVCEQELRRALDHGFLQSELDEIRADRLRDLDESVEREKTRESQAFLREILRASEERTVPTDPETQRKILKPAIQALTVEACHKAFVKAWSEGTLSISGSGNLDLGPDAGEKLRAVYEESNKVKVEPWKKEDLAKFAYASSKDKTGKIKTQKHIEDLDVHQYEFENGVKLNVKKTDFKEKQIITTARIGEGLLTLDPSQFAQSMAASQVFIRSGLKAHSDDDLRKLTAGKRVGVSFGVAPDFFNLGGQTTKEDLLMQCELMCAYLNEPGWREDGIRQYLKSLPQLFEGLKHQVQGPLVTEYIKLLHGGDPRFGIPEQKALESITEDILKGWLSEHLQKAPIELSLVGDLDVESTVAAVSQTFGALPARRTSLNAMAERRKSPGVQPALNKEYEVETKIPKALVYIAFPMTDGIDPKTRYRLHMLGLIANDRMRLEIREKLGASYSPRASAEASRVYPGDGALNVQAMSEPANVKTLVEGCLTAISTLGEKGTTEEELNRLREPHLANIRDNMRENGFWLNHIAESQTKPQDVEELRTLAASFQAITVDEINALAKKYLKRDRASVCVVNPKKKEATTEPATETKGQ